MTIGADALSHSLRSRVLDRLELNQPSHYDLESLSSLYAAWRANFPFDNAQKRVYLLDRTKGVLPGGSPSSFLESWLATGSGGTCWASSQALCAIAVTLGFDAKIGIGTMITTPEPPPIERRGTHGTVIVTLDDQPYVLDTHILTDLPLPLRSDCVTQVGGPCAARAVPCKDDGLFRIWFDPRNGKPEMSCLIDRLDSVPEFIQNKFALSETNSPFNTHLYVRRRVNRGLVLCVLNQLVRVDDDGTLQTKMLENRAERDEFLIRECRMAPAFVATIPMDEATV